MPHPVDLLVGKRIKSARYANEMTQEELASRLGITFQQVQKYETAQNRISASRLSDLAFALNYTVDYFFEKSSVINPILDKASLTLIKRFSKMSPSKRKLFSKLAKDL